MREIRFRAWDKKNKQMSVDTFGQSDWGDYLVDFGSDSRDIADENFIWLQYTGLKDKNDKEIYEGDIIRGIKEHYPDRIDIVAWDDYNAGFDPFYNNYEVDGASDRDSFEIIGNIYENPELLSQTS